MFIRELIQNAHDGIKRRSKADAGYGRIDIETRPAELQLVIRDNGVGMNEEDLVTYLSSIGRLRRRRRALGRRPAGASRAARPGTG